MKTKMKWGGALLALALTWLGGATARAAGVTDSLTVTITPNASYVVSISSDPNAGSWLNLGTVNLGGSTWTVRPATVAVQSSYGATELSLQGTMLSGGWSFETANTGSLGTDKLAGWAVFTDTSVAAAPAQASGYFSGTAANVDGSDVISGGNVFVGTSNSKSQYVALPGDAGYKTMINIPSESVDAPASHAHLWLRFKLPPSTTNTTAKVFFITLTASGQTP